MIYTLRPGDIFCTRNPMALGRMINAIQAFNSVDNKSVYSHSGFFVDFTGTSFEALWTNKRQNALAAYEGKQIIIGRNLKMTSLLFKKGWDGVRHHEGKPYAGHRLFFFLIPPLAKYLNLGLGVCSELTMKFLYKAGLSEYWKGVNPDQVAEMIQRWDDYVVIYEGECPRDYRKLNILIEAWRLKTEYSPPDGVTHLAVNNP